MKKSVLLTGASGQIGHAIIENLVNRSITVHAVIRSDLDLSFITLEKRHYVIPHKCESLADSLAVERVMSGIEEQITGLIYGAAIFNRFNSIGEIELNQLQEIFNVNVFGAFLWNRAFAEKCRSENVSGSVVNIASQAAFTGGYGGVIPYASSKGALISMTKGLAKEYAKDGIRINCVAPGFIETNSMRGDLDNGTMNKFIEKVPMGRLGFVDEVARAVYFLLSDDSTYTTGATLDVTGGQLMK